jgi:hypothetical protein
MGWLKRMEEANKMAVIKAFQPCREPAELVGINWEDLHIDNLTCQGTVCFFL